MLPSSIEVDRKSWLWANEVMKEMLKRSDSNTFFFDNKTWDNWLSHSEAKRTAKKAVAAAKATHCDDVSEMLSSRDGDASSIDSRSVVSANPWTSTWTTFDGALEGDAAMARIF